MSPALSILAGLNTNAKQLSLCSLATLQSYSDVTKGAYIGLAAVVSGLPKNKLDQLLTT